VRPVETTRSRWALPFVLAAVLHAGAAVVFTQVYLGRDVWEPATLRIGGRPGGSGGTPGAGGMSFNLVPGQRPEQRPLPMTAGPLAGEVFQMTRRLADEPGPTKVDPWASMRQIPPPMLSAAAASSLVRAATPVGRTDRPLAEEAAVRSIKVNMVAFGVSEAGPGPGGVVRRVAAGFGDGRGGSGGGQGTGAGAGAGSGSGSGGSGGGSGTGVGAGAGPAGDLEPEYPAASIRRGEQGRVVVEALVRADGSVAEARVVESSSYSRLDEAALKAVRAAQFTPARRNGQAVESWVKVPVRFVLK